MRRLVCVLVATLCASVLTSCTVPIAGLAGIGVNADGELVGYLWICHDSLDGATLYYDDSSTQATSDPSITVGKWQARAPITGTWAWTLAAPGNGWSASTPMRDLTDKRSYTLFGWTKDNSWAASSVTFTLAEVAAVRPGQVLHWAGRSVGKPERDVNEISSQAKFEAMACRISGS